MDSTLKGNAWWSFKNQFKETQWIYFINYDLNCVTNSIVLNFSLIYLVSLILQDITLQQLLSSQWKTTYKTKTPRIMVLLLQPEKKHYLKNWHDVCEDLSISYTTSTTNITQKKWEWMSTSEFQKNFRDAWRL